MPPFVEKKVVGKFFRKFKIIIIKEI